jgi:hypothetical protein
MTVFSIQCYVFVALCSDCTILLTITSLYFTILPYSNHLLNLMLAGIFASWRPCIEIQALQSNTEHKHAFYPWKLQHRDIKFDSFSLPYIQPLDGTSGYHRFVLYSTLGHVGGSNNCGGYILMRVVMTHMLANGALVYLSQGGRYRAEGCMALG